MAEKRVPIMFSASGALDMDLSSGVTPADVMQMLEHEYGLKVDKAVSPFAIVHDKMMNKYSAVEFDEEFPKNLDPKKHIVRLVMPFGGE